MDWSRQTSLHGLFKARILEWVAISFSRGSSWPRGWTCISLPRRPILYHRATREVQVPTWTGPYKNPRAPSLQGASPVDIISHMSRLSAGKLSVSCGSPLRETRICAWFPLDDTPWTFLLGRFCFAAFCCNKSHLWIWLGGVLWALLENHCTWGCSWGSSNTWAPLKSGCWASIPVLPSTDSVSHWSSWQDSASQLKQGI